MRITWAFEKDLEESDFEVFKVVNGFKSHSV